MRKYITIAISIILIGGSYYIAKGLVANKKKRKPTSEKVVQSVFVEKVKNGAIPIQIIESGRLVAKKKNRNLFGGSRYYGTNDKRI